MVTQITKPFPVKILAVSSLIGGFLASIFTVVLFGERFEWLTANPLVMFFLVIPYCVLIYLLLGVFTYVFRRLIPETVIPRDQNMMIPSRNHIIIYSLIAIWGGSKISVIVFFMIPSMGIVFALLFSWLVTFVILIIGHLLYKSISLALLLPSSIINPVYAKYITWGIMILIFITILTIFGLKQYAYNMLNPACTTCDSGFSLIK